MSVTRAVSLPVVKSDAGPMDGGRREGLARELRQLITGEVRFGHHDRLLYATDASMYQVEPLGVVCPRSIREAEAVVRFCLERDVPILPRGGGTSLAGQTVNEAVVIDFSPFCRGLIEVNAAERWARLEPGIVLDDLNAALAPHGLMFGPDVATSSQANLGGMIGNNSAGARSILFGRTVEHVLGLEVITGNGERLSLHPGTAAQDDRIRSLTSRIDAIIQPIALLIDERFPKITRHVDGYNLDIILRQIRESPAVSFHHVNLAQLVCGSEGTLAVTLEAKLNLVPRPQRAGLAIVAFAGVDAALQALTGVLETGPSAVELIDDVVINLALRNTEYRRYVELLPNPPAGSTGAVLYVEYFASSDDELAQRFQSLRQQFTSHMILIYTDAAAMAQAWRLRKAGEPLLHGLPGPRKPLTFIEDLAVDPRKLAAFVAEFRQIVARHGTQASYYAHASVGCLHIRPLVNVRDVNDRRIMESIAEEATDLVMRYGGALSGEHGDGRLRSGLLERYFGLEICNAFRAVKSLFDPKNLLNPGNIVSPHAMLERLRVKPNDRWAAVPAVKTFFRYEREHGFGEAVEMCNGAGVCRKMKGGTMCPSYRATRDERHATRGRGNALRLAITGQLSNDGVSPAWNDEETKKTLDLCLSCKACKSECPSNVDVAKLKAEYLAQSYAAGARMPLSARIFGNVRTLNRLGSGMHPIANAISSIGPLRQLAKRILGIHPKRELPQFGQPLHRWFAARSQGRSSNIPWNVGTTSKRTRGGASGLSEPGVPVVVIFPDCFTTYNEPHIGKAAVHALESLGYRVALPKLGCCGRAMISNGLLERSARTCRRTAEELLKCVQREGAVAVVGCEPSCISAIKDEWLELEMGVDAQPLRELAAKSFLIEQFIDLMWDQHPQPPAQSWVPSTQSLLLHGHCHQKALWGIESSANALRRFCGNQLHVLDSGCCGMAGSFGYTRDHYDISMQIGELSLFGPVRESPDAVVLAPGTSCRQQIHDALGRSAMHPIEWIANRLTPVDSGVARE